MVSNLNVTCNQFREFHTLFCFAHVIGRVDFDFLKCAGASDSTNFNFKFGHRFFQFGRILSGQVRVRPGRENQRGPTLFMSVFPGFNGSSCRRPAMPT